MHAVIEKDSGRLLGLLFGRLSYDLYLASTRVTDYARRFGQVVEVLGDPGVRSAHPAQPILPPMNVPTK
jgi:hypothetical protein